MARLAANGLLLTIAASALVIAFTWPWCLHWGTHFLNHIDPPFHAWKLEFMARRILAGDLLLSSGNTNMLYPNSGALYFEALQYPASLAAAPLLALGMRPEIAYHVVLVLFWALSAPCISFLLRELRCGTAVATTGAMVFTILPLRTRYMVALQLELLFALPLFYAFVIRFFRRPNIRDAALAAISWWLLAISELNTAVFAGATAPLLCLAFLSARPRTLLSRGFWLSALAGCVTAAATIRCLLAPYLEQRGEGAVSRSIAEIIKNSGQPFAYLLPWGRFRPWGLPGTRADELSVYPTLTLLAAAAAAAVIWLARPALNTDRRDRLAFALAGRAVRILAPLSCALFAATLLPCQLEWLKWDDSLKSLLRASSNIAAVSAILLSMAPQARESERVTFLRGLASIAALSCLLSFGPLVVMGHPRVPLMSQSNHVYKTAVELVPMLSSFRTVSRFGILVVFFVFCAAFCSIDSLARRVAIGGCHRRRLAAAASAAVFVLCAVECVPPMGWNSAYRAIDRPRLSPSMSRLFADHPIRTLVGVPMGERGMEGMRMFSLVKGDFPYVFAWCGFFPPYSLDICESICKLDRERFHEHIASLYPPALVFIDHDWIWEKGRNPNGAPADSISTLPDGRRIFDIDLWMSRIADEVDSDGRFSLWEPKPLPPSPKATRRFRTDVAAMNPVMAAEITAISGAVVEMRLNGELLGSAVADAGGAVSFQVDLDSVPAGVWSRSAPNSLEFASRGALAPEAQPVRITHFSLRGRDGSYHDPCAPYTVEARPAPPEDPYRPLRDQNPQSLPPSS